MAYKPKKYRVINTRVCLGETCAEPGDTVYEQSGYDYGLANDDTRLTGLEHVTVTKNEDGSYPGFTIPKKDLVLVTD